MDNHNRMKLLLVILTLTVLLYMIFVQLRMQFDDRAVRPLWYPIPKTRDIENQQRSLRNVSFSKKGKGERNDDLDQTLLFLSPQHWFDDWIGNKWETSHPFSNCPVSNCVLTKQRRFMDKADAVIFRARCLRGCMKKMKRGQVWILFEHEPPTRWGRYRDLNKHCHRNLFNWTITYRRDSDFTFVHGRFSKVSSPYNETVIDMILKAKTKTAVGFISHCHVQSRRNDYITKLRKYGIDVDIYGKCGTLHCDSGLKHRMELKVAWNLTPVVGLKKDCFDVLDSRYKFYLSFENSLCDDYVTEKSLHLVLRHNIVPIIRDANNRTLFSPPKSYLDTKDFHDVKSLATRIKFMSKNLDEYKKYFSGKNTSPLKQLMECCSQSCVIFVNVYTTNINIRESTETWWILYFHAERNLRFVMNRLTFNVISD